MSVHESAGPRPGAQRRPESVLDSAASGIWAFAVPALTALVTAPWLARGLGPHAFAVYSLAVAYGATAASLGLGRAVIRELSRPETSGAARHRGQVVASGLWLGAAVGGVLALVLALAAGAIVGAAEAGGAAEMAVLRLAALGALPVTIGGVALAVPQGLGLWRLFARITVAAAVLTSVGGAVLAWSGAGAWAVLAWSTTVAAMAAAVSVAAARRLVPRVPILPSWPVMGRLVGLGGEILGAQVVFALWVLAERVLVSRSLGPPALAAYVVALMLGAYLQAAVVAAAQVLAPSVNRASGTSAGADTVSHLYRSATLGVAALSGAGGATIAGAGPAFLHLWMGPEIAAAAAPALAPLGLAFALNGLTTAAWFVGEGLGHQRRNLAAAFISATIGLLSLTVLTASWQVAGAGLARVAAMAGAPVYILWIERSVRPAMRGPWQALCLVIVPASLALAMALHWSLDGVVPTWPRLAASCALGWLGFAAAAWTGAGRHVIRQV